jgi:hypothetical protein
MSMSRTTVPRNQLQTVFKLLSLYLHTARCVPQWSRRKQACYKLIRNRPLSDTSANEDNSFRNHIR